MHEGVLRLLCNCICTHLFHLCGKNISGCNEGGCAMHKSSACGSFVSLDLPLAGVAAVDGVS